MESLNMDSTQYTRAHGTDRLAQTGGHCTAGRLDDNGKCMTPSNLSTCRAGGPINFQCSINRPTPPHREIKHEYQSSSTTRT